MAFSEFGHISIELLDNLGVTVSAVLYVEIDPTKTVDQLITDALAIALQMDGVTDSQIVNTVIKVVAGAPPTGKSTPASTAENERTGLFNYAQSGSTFKFGIDIPAIIEAAIVSGKIDLTNTAVAAFVSAVVTPFTSFVISSTAPHVLTALRDALITFRKHRRAESRRSVEIP